MSTGDLQSAFVELIAARVRDRKRLAAVAATGLMDTQADAGFDRIAALAARLLDAPFGFVTLVDDQRSFWKACIGVDATGPADRQNTVAESFCQYVIGLRDVLLLDDVTLDERTRDNPSITSMGVRAWAGAPLVGPTGEVLGTVCVVDTRPRSWDSADAEVLTDLAAIASHEVQARQVSIDAARSEALLDAILQRAPVGFCLLDPDMRFVMVNAALAAIIGRPGTDHVGRTIGEVLPDLAGRLVPIAEAVIESQQAVADIEIIGEPVSAPGAERIWTTSFFPIEGVGVGTVVMDITERVRSRRRAELLAEITRMLGNAETVDDVSRAVADHAPRYLHADLAAIGLAETPGPTLTLRARPGLATPFDETRFHHDDATPYGEALRTGQMVFVATAEQRRREYPASVALTEAVQVVASASAPLTTAAGDCFGVLNVGWRDEVDPANFPSAQLVTLAGLVAQTLERVRSTADRRELAAALQRSLLSPAPRIDGIDIAVRYQPAAGSIGFGGDWYDVVPIDAHRVALVVGDVVGHDPTAAAHMSRVRTIVSTLVQLDTDLSRVFGLAEQILATDGTRTLASVALTMVDTSTHTLTTLLAGHPPPLLLHDGGVTPVPHSLRPWLGVPAPDPTLVSSSYTPGALLVSYTDGLVETRTTHIGDDLDRLRQYLVGRAGDDVDHLADALIDDFTSLTERRDDIALIVARL